MEHLKAYILALKNMNTDFTIRIAQQSDALELMSLFQETVLHINKRDYSEAEVADWASCGFPCFIKNSHTFYIRSRESTTWFPKPIN